MSLVLELVLQVVLEFVAYGIGRVFVMIFLPWYGVESVTRRDPDDRKFWKWRGASYLDGGRRILRIETVQLFGIAILVGVVAMIVVLRN